MATFFFSTGQTARAVGISQSDVRALCASGAIRHEVTPGGQLRIPQSEVERLKRDGVPPIARPLPFSENEDARVAVRSVRGRSALLAAPSDKVIGSAEDVVRLENELKAIGLRRQTEEQLDWFRERAAKGAERKAQQDQIERERKAQVEAEGRHQSWKISWLEYALKSIPKEAPQDVRLEVHQLVEQVLQRFDPRQPASITRPLVDAAVDRALTSWRNVRQISRIILQASEAYQLPWGMKHDTAWKARMYEAAAAGIARLREGATKDEMEAAANQAIFPLRQEFEHGDVCTDLVRGVSTKLSGDTWEERKQAEEDVRKALSVLPIGTSRRELERARDVALTPIRASIAAREDDDMRANLLRSADFCVIIRLREALREKARVAIRESFAEFPAGTPRRKLEEVREGVIERYVDIQKKQEHK